MKDTVCIYSGGMDSFTLAAETLAQGRLHSCLSFDYGQRHVKELEYAALNCEMWNVPHRVVDLTALRELVPNSALTGEGVEMPEGHYAEENMRQTVVPNRNMIMLSLAAAYALSHGLTVVRFGAHSGDHTVYPDCRPLFVNALNGVLELCDWNMVQVEAPYLTLDKAAILRIGYDMNLNYENTWTCYKGGDKACGRCGSCQERLEAFDKIGEEDPLDYETRELIAESDREG